MKKKIAVITLFVSLMLCAFAFSAKADGKIAEGITCPIIDKIFSELFYTESSIPTDIQICTSAHGIGLVNAEGDTEEVIALDVVFQSGDENLREAVGASAELYDDYQHITLSVDGYEMKEVGSAVFSIHAESEHWSYDTEKTLYVVDYSEYPLFEITAPTVDIVLTEGESISRETIFDMMFLWHGQEIADALSPLPEVISLDSLITPPFVLGAWAEGLKDGFYTIKVLESGTYEVGVGLHYSNISAHSSLLIHPDGSNIQGPDSIEPGANAEYSITEAKDGESVSWRVVGDAAVIDDAGIMTAGPECGEVIIMAALEDGRTLAKPVSVRTSVFGSLRSLEWHGWQIPVPDNESWETREFEDSEKSENIFVGVAGDTGIKVAYRLETPLVANHEDAINSYQQRIPKLTHRVMEFQTKQLNAPDGWPVQALMYETHNKEQTSYKLFMLYSRDLFQIIYYVTSEADPLTWADAEKIISHFGYDPSGVPFTAADAAITISQQDDLKYLSPDEKASFTATFGDEEKLGNNASLAWKLLDSEDRTIEPKDNIATISNDGSVTVSKKLKNVTDITVCAYNPILLTEGRYSITLLPAIKKIIAQPSSITMYTGDSTPQTVQVTREPDIPGVPFGDITWTAGKNGIVEIVPGENGQAVMTAVAAGKTKVTVTGPSKTKTQITVVVVDPVTDIEIDVKGKAQPGKSITCSALLTPKTAGNKNVSWSINVDETIATIDAKGKLKIMKDVPSGTEIVISCTAEGAPQPVTTLTTITVE
ncbi:MAG: hypothetical protein IKE15_11180 [Clostridia bacterium]|nr:hypothetical protein [Clostridia bacterium]